MAQSKRPSKPRARKNAMASAIFESGLGVASFMASQVRRSEGGRQQLVRPEATPYPVKIRDMDQSVRRRKLTDALSARPARRDESLPVAQHEHGRDSRLAGGDHGRNGAGFGASADRRGGVLDIAAGKDGAAGRRQRGADLEARIGRVSALAGEPRGFEERRQLVARGPRGISSI